MQSNQKQLNVNPRETTILFYVSNMCINYTCNGQERVSPGYASRMHSLREKLTTEELLEIKNAYK